MKSKAGKSVNRPYLLKEARIPPAVKEFKSYIRSQSPEFRAGSTMEVVSSKTPPPLPHISYKSGQVTNMPLLPSF
jgi:hypothetical protein